MAKRQHAQGRAEATQHIGDRIVSLAQGTHCYVRCQGGTTKHVKVGSSKMQEALDSFTDEGLIKVVQAQIAELSERWPGNGWDTVQIAVPAE